MIRYPYPIDLLIAGHLHAVPDLFNTVCSLCLFKHGMKELLSDTVSVFACLMKRLENDSFIPSTTL